jgi:hypothetical protein
VDLDLEHVVLVVGRHGEAGDGDRERRQGLKLKAYDGGLRTRSPGRPAYITAPRMRRMVGDSRSMPLSPANQNMTAIEMCWTCLTEYGSPALAPKRSIHVLVMPYRKMTKHSTISAEIALEPAGLRFHAHPKSAYAPR